MTATLQIERASDGWADRNRSYDLIVNGELRAKLRRGKKEVIEVAPGNIEVYLKIDWCRSRAVTLNVAPDSEVQMFCRPRNALTSLYGITFGRKNYMQLEVK